MKHLFVLPILVAVFLSGCVSQYQATPPPAEESKQTTQETIKESPTTEQQTSYFGKIIAGTTTKYLRFNKADYQKALNEGKVIYFYFYANWCPICAKERPNILAAFNELNYPNAVGFEVHFNDNEVTPDDEDISRQFGISYQHTSIIHVVGVDKTGKEAFRSLQPISKETIKEKIASLV
ncbi:MAG: thioredoxin family protein [Candidatus Aenigmarchaeota archaeon]|nr:thioredoxin family protein [Candidatus Aenigmarchaeota archaeon]